MHARRSLVHSSHQPSALTVAGPRFGPRAGNGAHGPSAGNARARALSLARRAAVAIIDGSSPRGGGWDWLLLLRLRVLRDERRLHLPARDNNQSEDALPFS